MAQPHSNYLINELIAAGNYAEAERRADENATYFEAKADEQRNLFLDAASLRLEHERRLAS